LIECNTKKIFFHVVGKKNRTGLLKNCRFSVTLLTVTTNFLLYLVLGYFAMIRPGQKKWRWSVFFSNNLL